MRPPRDKWRFGAMLLALLVCGLLTALHARSVSRGQTDPVTRTVRDRGLVPAQVLVARLGQRWHLSAGSILSGPRLARENADLNKRVLELSAQNNNLRTAQAENVRLHRLLGFEQTSLRPLLAAQVTALKPNPNFDTLTLNQGIAHGVHPRSVVLSPSGALTGQVLDASPGSSNVLLLTDTGSSVGAVVRNHTLHEPVGLCQGAGAGRIQMTYLRSDAKLHVGDSVVTSGLGGVFPGALPLGTISAISVDKTRSLQTAVLRPAADFDHLEEAFVIQSAPIQSAPPPVPAPTLPGTVPR